MTTTNKFLTESALNYNEQTKQFELSTMQIDLPEDSSIEGIGRSITHSAFRKMIANKLEQLKTDLLKISPSADEATLRSSLGSKPCSVEFGKESILRILSQSECIGLRFTFCLNDLMEESVIISGLKPEDFSNADGTVTKRAVLINKESYKEGSTTGKVTMDDEKGVGRTYDTFLTETGITLDELISFNSANVTKLTDAVLKIL